MHLVYAQVNGIEQGGHAFGLDGWQLALDVLHPASEGRNQVRAVRKSNEKELILRVGPSPGTGLPPPAPAEFYLPCCR